MRTLCTLMSGSHLYGLATPSSDVDMKSVFIPDARDILLQRAPRAFNAKQGDDDQERFALHFFLKLAGEGQTIPLEMLFTEPTTPVDPIWEEIVAGRDRLISKQNKGFLRYCQGQATKFSVKGERLAAARDAYAALDLAQRLHGAGAKLEAVESDLRWLADKHGAIEIGVAADGVKFVSICGRKALFTASIATARDLADKIVEDYGERARRAEVDGGADWKALSHALRVGQQAIELLETGGLRFPFAGRAHLLDVKLGRLPYAKVVEELDELLVAVERAAASSALPDEPDHAWIEDVAMRAYGDEVAHALQARIDPQANWKHADATPTP